MRILSTGHRDKALRRSHSSTSSSATGCVRYLPRGYLVREIASCACSQGPHAAYRLRLQGLHTQVSSFLGHRAELTCVSRVVTRTPQLYGGEDWIRTSAQLRADLQSATFGLSVTSPYWSVWQGSNLRPHAS